SALPICYSPRAIGALGEACASYPHHQLAHHLAVRERLERGRRLGEWIDLLDVARQLALRAPMGKRSDGGLGVLLVVANPRSPEHAEHGATLEQHEIERQFRDLAGGKPDDEVSALPGERAHRRLAVAATDRVEHNIDAMLAAEALERLAQILPFVVHHLMRA